MSGAVISVRDLSKRYQLGQTLQHDTFRDHLAHAAKTVLKKFHTESSGSSEPASEAKKQEFWALRDVSFDVAQGEVVGIIGRNGAGKSTLLKILSQITEPTSGEARINGRIAALLEVGTGFHPELTGRENIYLNGAILGMSRAEITAKFDEIIDFSGVEKFLDTPVKRYSSGMSVRLAFAVAAHLEPEILIVDEVLAVGDAQFQKKCLGKMQDAANQEGRTILFVSHNMSAVKSLCDRALLLRNGSVAHNGPPREVIDAYLSRDAVNRLKQSWDSPEIAPGNETIRVRSIQLLPHLEQPTDAIDVRTPITVRFDFWALKDGSILNLSLHLLSIDGQCVMNIGTPALTMRQGLWTSQCEIPGNFLNDGVYTISMMVVRNKSTPIFNLEDALCFEVLDHREGAAWHGKWAGAVRPTSFPFTLISSDSTGP
jgi:lipopolysaccharide transport system ATP-binding protein